ncbi:hypothetical protein HUU59_04675 [bacterium]|nr:hypothetical protein [bacterium]
MSERHGGARIMVIRSLKKSWIVPAGPRGLQANLFRAAAHPTLKMICRSFARQLRAETLLISSLALEIPCLD